MTSAAETCYANSRGARIAYQVVGDGPVDVVLVSHEGVVLEAMWEQPLIVRALEKLGAFSRSSCSITAALVSRTRFRRTTASRWKIA